MMRPLLPLLLGCLLAGGSGAEEVQSATVLKETALYAEPYSDAATLGRLKAKQEVAVLGRQGGWYQVRRGELQGWLRMSHVRFSAQGAAQADGSGLRQTVQLLSTGRSGASGVTVATGIRGLEVADVANAAPDHQAVERLERYQVSPEQAENFAQGAQLQSQPLGYLNEKK